MVTTRKALFGRLFLTRCDQAAQCPDGVPLYATPSGDGHVVVSLPLGTEIWSVNIGQQWLTIAGQNGETVYIQSNHVEIVPPFIIADQQRRVALSPTPGFASDSLESVVLEGAYRVRGARRLPNGERWYRIAVGEREGWMTGPVHPQWTLPIVHFAAGLLRYAQADYRGAAIEFKAFIERNGTPEQNVTAAAAYQFLAVSKVAGRPLDTLDPADVLSSLTTAIEFTPYDPAAYTLRFVAQVGVGTSLQEA